MADLLVTYADARTREDDVALILATTARVNTTVQRTSPRLAPRNSYGAAE